MDESDFPESPEDELPDDSEFAPEPPAPASTPAPPPASPPSGPSSEVPMQGAPPSSAPRAPHPAPARYVAPAPARGSDPRRREPPESAPREPRRAIEVRSRAHTVNGEEWIASEAGRTASGGAGDSRAALLLVLFARAAAPEQPVIEALTTVPDLDHLGDEELAALLARARPFRVVQERSEVFPDTRRKGQKGS
jgi:hypothetical protein